MKVMIVDDSGLFRKRLIESIAEVHSLSSIIQAANVEEAISKFEKREPDVIILDICLAAQSGIEVLEHVKKIQY